MLLVSSRHDGDDKCDRDGDWQDDKPACWCLRFCCLMQALNTDKDSQLSAEAIAAAAESLLTLDQDDDGALSAEELSQPVADKPDDSCDCPGDDGDDN